MKIELTLFLGHNRYEHQKEKGNNYRNGSYYLRFTIKGIGEIDVKIPRDRQGNFNERPGSPIVFEYLKTNKTGRTLRVGLSWLLELF